MRALRRALGLSVVAACVVKFATPASADDAVQVLGGEPAVEAYEPTDEPPACVSVDARALLAEGPVVSGCTPTPGTVPPTVTYDCSGSGAVAPNSSVMDVTMNGSATTSDTRVLFTRITCTLRQGSTTVFEASGSAFARAAFVQARTTVPLATYRLCKSGSVQYRDNNGVTRWFSFGNANC